LLKSWLGVWDFELCRGPEVIDSPKPACQLVPTDEDLAHQPHQHCSWGIHVVPCAGSHFFVPHQPTGGTLCRTIGLLGYQFVFI
jgi:hypothetical protein